MRRALAAVAVVLALVVGAGAASRTRTSGLERALAIAENQEAFSTQADAGQAMARISEELLRHGVECREEEQDQSFCKALLDAAAWTEIVAFQLARCTLAGLDEARRTTHSYLQTITPESSPRSPKPPRC